MGFFLSGDTFEPRFSGEEADDARLATDETVEEEADEVEEEEAFSGEPAGEDEGDDALLVRPVAAMRDGFILMPPLLESTG